ncbi:hypothetical protein BDQ94DRAFT_148711 [Aspergillus welwitschiae]|uniref:Uncharacterized protein n=1 Tax=Aspergillus welwitschiae TaxID=1341132 RepID=A0A3F3PUG6_9EURO|nr:hypothetical protein BDQ94DRAFT_148711 [Aspergillus welwitschiae]RDH30553.1 hypothetical protein BDQ94DRAFT_148711 [Aspergillus welwitschiae]
MHKYHWSHLYLAFSFSILIGLLSSSGKFTAIGSPKAFRTRSFAHSGKGPWWLKKLN